MARDLVQGEIRLVIADRHPPWRGRLDLCMNRLDVVAAEQQIQARNQSGVSEDALKEFSMMFRHFDKDKSGRLNHNEFKSCLRALGMTNSLYCNSEYQQNIC